MSRKNKYDRVVVEAKKAYRATPLYHMEKLLKEEQRWRRKETIARNKLDTIQHVIRVSLIELATPKGDQ